MGNTAQEDFWKHQAESLPCQLREVEEQLQDYQQQESVAKRVLRLFNEDQVLALVSFGARVRKWSNETLQKIIKNEILLWN